MSAEKCTQAISNAFTSVFRDGSCKILKVDISLCWYIFKVWFIKKLHVMISKKILLRKMTNHCMFFIHLPINTLGKRCYSDVHLDNLMSSIVVSEMCWYPLQHKPYRIPEFLWLQTHKQSNSKQISWTWFLYGLL